MTLVTALDDLGPLLTASLDERVIHLHTAAVGQWKGGATASPSVIGTHSGTQVAGVCECFSRFVLQLLLHWERFFVPACTATPIRDAHATHAEIHGCHRRRPAMYPYLYACSAPAYLALRLAMACLIGAITL